MAFKKTLAERLFNISKNSAQALTKCRISSSSVGDRALSKKNAAIMARDPDDNGFFCRFFQKRAMFQPAMSPAIRELAAGDNLVEKFKSVGIARDRIRLDGLIHPVYDSLVLDPDRANKKGGLTVNETKKLLKIAQMEIVKSKLREIPNSCIPYSEFVRLCGQGFPEPDQGLGIAKMLDESGTVIVLGNVVFLRPEQVAKAMEALIPSLGQTPNDSRMEELKELEDQKAAIDEKAEALVRRELWCGLGFGLVQTVAFMRLTFWELSWDVMEPICFYVTSFYFMAGYTFFLRTSKEPSFVGFFQGRFNTKQKQLMKVRNFDIDRYNDLQKCFSNLR